MGSPPRQPQLLEPADGASVDNTPLFRWVAAEGADNHVLEIDNDPDFSSPVLTLWLGPTDNSYEYPEPGLPEDNYYWRVRAVNEWGENISDN